MGRGTEGGAGVYSRVDGCSSLGPWVRGPSGVAQGGGPPAGTVAHPPSFSVDRPYPVTLENFL